MLKKVNRLKKRYQFNYVYRAGEHFSGKFLVLYASPSKTKNIKIGFSVTKKIGHAVVRNKIRRRLREIVKGNIDLLKQNLNIIVVAKDNILSATFEQLQADYISLTYKANIVNEKNI